MWWSRKEASPPPSPEAPAALPVTRAEWRSVAPIQRVVAEHPLVNPVQRFSSSLTSWQSPGYLEPLGHRVGPEEPAGVIGDLARPRTIETPAPAMPVVQRATRKRSGLSRLWGASASAPASVQRSESAPAPEETVQLLPEESAPLPMPSLVLPAVASREVFRPLTSAGAVAIPASPPVRTVQAIREPSVVDTPAELPLVAPDSVETVPVQAPEPAPAERSPAEPAPPVLPVIQRTEQAAPRRLGLGAPILPDSGSVPPPSADAPLAGAVETSVAPVEDAPEPTQVADETPLPVSRLADTTPSAESAPLSGATPLKPVQRVREEPPVSSVKDSLPALTTGKESFTDIGRPGEVTVSRMAEAVPELPTVTSSRSSPVNTFRPLDLPEIRSGTTEPPGTPGGSTSVSPPPAPLPVVRAVEDPVVPATRALETPSLPISRAVEGSTPAAKPVVETPALPVARAVDGSLPSATRPAESTTLPVTRAAETLPLTVARAVETPAPSVARAMESSPLPVARPIETQALPVSRAVETPAPSAQSAEASSLPVARPIETSALPVARTVENSPLPVARAIEAPARMVGSAPLPVARAIEGAEFPVARAAETLALPVAPTLDAPASTIPPLVAQPPAPSPVRHTESAPLPTLPMSRAIETPTAPMTLPVARVLDTPMSTIRRAGVEVRSAPTITSGASSSPPMLTGSLPVAQRAEETPGEHPSVPGVGDGPLPVARIAEPTTRPSTVDFLPTAQRATNGSTPHSEDLTLNLPPVVVSRQAEAPIVQREPDPPAPAPAPEPPAAAPVPAPAAAATQPETDELVKKLFDPLLRRLKTELRLDRERRGALTDRPH